MNKGFAYIISVLIATLALSGCGSMAAHDAERPILSAAEAQAQIRVTVRPLPPAPKQDALIAANH